MFLSQMSNTDNHNIDRNHLARLRGQTRMLGVKTVRYSYNREVVKGIIRALRDERWRDTQGKDLFRGLPDIHIKFYTAPGVVAESTLIEFADKNNLEYSVIADILEVFL